MHTFNIFLADDMQVPVLLIGIFVVCITAEKKRYVNYRVYRVTVKTEDQLKQLEDLELQTAVPEDIGFSFWKSARRIGNAADIYVSPNRTEYIVDIFEKGKYSYYLMIENVQSLIDAEIRPRKAGSTFNWNDYYDLEKMHKWLKKMGKKYKNAEIIKAGKSYEGRNILGIKISHRKNNPGVFIESGMHAREWIAPAVATFIINQLLTSTNSTIRYIAHNYNWYIFPSVNPDGYVYTHTTDRNWRKTRSPQGECFGVDGNRNWDNKWMEYGSSNDSCSLTFAGSKPFSEIETRSLSKYIRSIQKQIKTYLSFHAYGQLLLLPYGHPEIPENYDDLIAIAKKAVNSLAKRFGTKYRYGSTYKIIYPASGASMSWVGTNCKVPIIYTYELRDRGRHGFLLPKEQIIPTAEETLDSIITILKEADALGYYKRKKENF